MVAGIQKQRVLNMHFGMCGNVSAFIMWLKIASLKLTLLSSGRLMHYQKFANAANSHLTKRHELGFSWLIYRSIFLAVPRLTV